MKTPDNSGLVEYKPTIIDDGMPNYDIQTGPGAGQLGLYVHWQFILDHADYLNDENDLWPDAWLEFSLDDVCDEIIESYGRYADGDYYYFDSDDADVLAWIAKLRAAADRLESMMKAKQPN